MANFASTLSIHVHAYRMNVARNPKSCEISRQHEQTNKLLLLEQLNRFRRLARRWFFLFLLHLPKLLLFGFVMRHDNGQIFANFVGNRLERLVECRPFLQLLFNGRRFDGQVAHNDVGKFRIQVAIVVAGTFVVALNAPSGPLAHVTQGVLQGKASNVDVVLFACFLAVWLVAGPFVSRFVEIRIRDENEALNAHEHLQNG